MDGSSVFDGEDASARLPDRGVELDIVGSVVDDYSPGFGRIRAHSQIAGHCGGGGTDCSRAAIVDLSTLTRVRYVVSPVAPNEPIATGYPPIRRHRTALGSATARRGEER